MKGVGKIIRDLTVSKLPSITVAVELSAKLTKSKYHIIYEQRQITIRYNKSLVYQNMRNVPELELLVTEAISQVGVRNEY